MENFTKDSITPYLSLLLAQKSSSKDVNVHNQILNLIKDITSKDKQLETSKTEVNDIGDLGTASYTGYRLCKSPSWISNKEFIDIEHHIFISFEVKNYYAFYFSESTKKDEVREYFGTKNLPDISVVKINQLNFNFINEDDIKMIWLSGIHGKSNYKANSKVLGGDGVADALDPLLDQSYMMSAVRTQIDGEKSTYGINTFKSSIWRGPCSSWQVFENRTLEILDKLNSHPQENESPISILSYPVPDCTDLSAPYDFCLIDYEFLQENDGQIRKELLIELQYEYSSSIVEQLTTNSSIIELDIFYNLVLIGNVKVQPIISDYKVRFEIIAKNPIQKKHFDKYLRVFNYPDLIKCWYESGHALVNAMVFKTGYRDVEYSNFLWTYFDGIDLTKEKPGNNKKKPELDRIGKDDSLFCWVQKNWNGQWIEPADFELKDKVTGWLFCDDGAGEQADFIHIDHYHNQAIISLIHVKAAKSCSEKREVSVGVHDIVLNQAIKNIRSCTRRILYDTLAERVNESQKKHCWRNGEKGEAKDFLTYLKNLDNNKSIRTRVIVIQPHTQKSVYEKFKGKKVRNQLDVLLISAENAVHSTGADFHIFGLHD